jgi:hypothetical protein
VYLLGLILLFCGNYLLYLKSSKTAHAFYVWEIRLKTNRQILQICAPFLLSCAGIIFIATTGILAGIFFGLFAYFMVASCTLVIRPLLSAERSKKNYAGK